MPSFPPPTSTHGSSSSNQWSSTTPTQQAGSGNAQSLRPARTMQYDFALPRLEREIEAGHRRSASNLRPRNAVSPDTWAIYQQVMRSYNQLPVHQSAAQVQASISAHLRARLPNNHNGPIIIVLGELHNTNGSVAQTMAVTNAMRNERDKVYLVEGTDEYARDSDYDASRAAIKLLQSVRTHPRGPDDGPLDQAEFAARIYPDREPPSRLRHMLQDTCAKLTGYTIGGFDPAHDDYHDNDGREGAMVNAVLQKGTLTGTTIVRAGDYHAPVIQQALKTLLPDAKVLCIAQAADPSPTNREAIHRMHHMLTDPDCLVLAGSDALEADRVEMTPMVSYAAHRPELVARIDHDYRTL